MMFWIMVPNNIFALLVIHFSLKGSGKSEGNMILGVKLPTIHQKDERVQEIVTQFQNTFKKLFMPFLFIQIIGYPIRQWVSISILWIFLYLVVMIISYTYCIEYYAQKLRKLKKESGWNKEQGFVLNIDTEVSRLKSTFPISRKHFLLPLLIIGVFGYLNIGKMTSFVGWSLFIVILLIFLVGVLIYEIFVRVAIVTYSENTDVNLALNKAYRNAWSKYAIFVSYISLMYLPLISMVNGDYGFNPFFTTYVIIIGVLSTIVSVVPMFMIHHKLQKLNTKLLQAEVEEYYLDDDEFWTVFTYNNPYDKKTWVNKRVGIGTTMNMATTGGKIFAYSSIIIVVATILWCMWISIPIDFDTIKMEQKGSYYEVGIWGDTYEMNADEILSVELLEELPPSYKNVGSSTWRMKTGMFSVEGYGHSTMYVMVEVPLYIVIEMEDESYVFMNGGDVEITMQYYEMLQKS